MTYQQHIFASVDETAGAVAELIRELTNARAELSQFFNLAVSGGSTPKLLFRMMADESFSADMRWEALRIFWVDERCVEPTHEESNFGMTYDSLLQHVKIPSENIFRMKGEDIPDNEAIRYADMLRHVLPAKEGYPVFDLILLGMGDDGHTASIFPDNMALLESEKTVAVATHPQSRQKRITLTGPTLRNAVRILFLVTGTGKANIAREILSQTQEAKKYPAAYIGTTAGISEWYMDKSVTE